MLDRRNGKRPIVVKVETGQKLGIPIWLAGVIAAVVLLFTGVGYHQLAGRLKVVTGTPIELPLPLNAFPTQVGAWAGKDVPISETVQRVTGCDDYLNRLYVHGLDDRWANVYIAYTARPRTMLGHQPEVCYVAGGWIHDSTEQSQVSSKSGLTIPCLIHRFHKPSPEGEEIVVTNFYIVNGQLTDDSGVFSGLGWRTPNIAGNPARYVAQVQISSILESATQTAMAELVDLILEFFPDKDGRVKVADRSIAASGL